MRTQIRRSARACPTRTRHRREPRLPAFSPSEKERRRYDHWCRRLAEIAPELPTLGRNIALRLILRAALVRLWKDPREWTPLMAGVGAILVREGEEPTVEDRQAAASLANRLPGRHPAPSTPCVAR
jgi:hypothetical protein